ncbi:MAG: DsbA family protein [Deltaproteobacteria bacterium]|nr:DsbA family protein [Deltaproteobacteria bacterium]
MHSRALSLLSLAGLLACNDVAPIETAAAEDGATTAAEGKAAEAGQVLARWDGGQVTYGQVKEKVGGELISQEVEYLTNKYQTTMQAVEGILIDALLESEAASRSMTIEQLLAAEVEDKVAQPADEEVAAFFEQVKPQLRGAPYEQAEPWLRMELLQRKQAEAFQVYIAAVKERHHVKVDVPFPEIPRIDIPIADYNPTKGPADAPITIIEFADFQCPYCSKVIPSLKQVEAAYPGKVRFVWKDFPLGGHPRALPAAVALHCAGDQGKTWEMYDVLFANQGALEDVDLKGYAQQIGLDVAAWESCTTSGKHEAHIQEDFQVGESHGVQATPSLFVNGILVSGALPFEHFAEIIDRELAKR